MVTTAFKQLARQTLAQKPWVWDLLRRYVRYSPRTLVLSEINERVNRFFRHQAHRFIARTQFGCLIAGETRDIVQRYVFLYGRWEPNLTSWFIDRLKRDDVFIDVGANIGYYSLLASTVIGDRGRVVAIEASPSIFEQLRANISLNSASNIRALHCAAAAVSGTLRLFRAPAFNLGASSTYDDIGFEDEGVVDARPLHELLTPDDIARARVIKIDVEGAEIGVVKGMLPLLPAARPELEIVIEVGGGPKGSPTAAESAMAIVPMLADEGFNVYRITNDYGAHAYARARRPARPQRIWNVEEISEECDLVFSRISAAAL
ncbi:MAG: FkbM family methyltransferase [Gammaproteobacteria bacterium]|nr:FkbM family methyltransferase [Gammaproteobacteria bacterium]